MSATFGVRTAREHRVLAAVYDLHSSPPTYDFISFLSEAERYRIANAFDKIAVVFQPGPILGFRKDELPPTLSEREFMLHHVCVPAAWRMRSVEEVRILPRRQHIQAAGIFPEGWTATDPVRHYGAFAHKRTLQCLQASRGARERVQRYADGKPYFTVTLREASYYPERNSLLPEWEKAIKWLEDRAYPVVVVNDASDSRSVYSYDLDMRLALYEGAIGNLGVMGGPMMLCLASRSDYIIFKPIVESCISTSISFLHDAGIEVGDQFGLNGTIVWAEDRAETIIEAIRYRYKIA